MPLEEGWLTNIAFYMGKHWLLWNSAAKKLERPVVPPWRVLPVINRIRSIIRTEYGKLTKQRPTLGVNPTSDGENSEQRAIACEKILEALWKPTGTDRHRRKAILWALITGTGWTMNYWDKKAGKRLEGDVYLGEVAVAARSPFSIYCDPLAEEMEDLNWLFDVSIRSPEYVLDHYGVRVDAEHVSTDEHYAGKLAAALDQDATASQTGVLVKQYWQRPTQDYPEGRFAIYVQDWLLWEGPLPYPKVPIPYVPWRHILVPGRLHGESVITDLLDTQRDINKTVGQIIEQKNLQLKPRVIAAEGQIVSPITGAPNEIILTRPMPGVPKVEFVRSPELAESIFKILDRHDRNLYEISGQHEVSHAQVPTGVKSGIAIAYLAEQDDTRLGPTAQAFEEALATEETYKLRLCRQFYQERRTATIIGDDNQAEIIEFSRDDIPEDVEVHVEAGSSLPQSRVAKQEFILSLWDKGLVADPRVVLKKLELGDVEGLYDEVEADISQAQREHETMKSGVLVPVHDYDNDAVHIWQHDLYRKTEEFETLPAEIQSIFAEHVQGHKDQRAAKQAEETARAASQAQTAGPGPGSGQPSLAQTVAQRLGMSYPGAAKPAGVEASSAVGGGVGGEGGGGPGEGPVGYGGTVPGAIETP